MASGRPVIAYRLGGAIDTVVEGETGIFFDEQSPEALNRAIDDFERQEHEFSPARIAKFAERFDRINFRRAIAAWVTRSTNHIVDVGSSVTPNGYRNSRF
jgi:glycosyltransferase involved in cell wall biosynthesis